MGHIDKRLILEYRVVIAVKVHLHMPQNMLKKLHKMSLEVNNLDIGYNDN